MPPDPVPAERICSVALSAVIRRPRGRPRVWRPSAESLGIDEDEIRKTRRADLHFAVAGLRGLPAAVIERRLAMVAPEDRDALLALMAAG
jgi:hypothetical protein